MRDKGDGMREFANTDVNAAHRMGVQSKFSFRFKALLEVCCHRGAAFTGNHSGTTTVRNVSGTSRLDGRMVQGTNTLNLSVTLNR